MNEIEIQQPEIQDCGHAHIGSCPFEDANDYNEYREHMRSTCDSYLCCIN